MESFCLCELKLWLLDHAVKHDMYDVVKHILKDKSTMEHLYGKLDGSNASEETQPTYLFLLLLEHLKESLRNFQPPESSHHFSWDKEALNLIIDILNATYKQKPFVDLHTFMKLVKLLKLMVIFRMLCESDDGHAICGTLNLLFPHWNGEKSKEKLEQMYGSESLVYADDMKKTNSETRKFILKLVLNGKYKVQYLKSHYGEDVRKMVKKCLPLLDVVISAVKNLIGPSTIEQIMSCTDEDFSSSNDPAVQIILEYFKPDMTADEYMELLKILEFSESQEEAMNISFGSPLEDSSILNIDDFDAERGNELKFSLIDDDTPTPSNDNLHSAPSNEHQKYVPLGLGPPSVKKTVLEETSEIHTTHEHMELITDSEDEEHL